MTWLGWEDLGGVLTDDPAVASWASNRLDCFARGTDSHMWHKWWNGSALERLGDLGGIITARPPRSPGVRTGSTASSAALTTRCGTSGGTAPRWSGWENLGGVLTSGAGVASWASNRLDCFVRGTDSHMWHKWWNGSRWSGWEDLGGVIDAAGRRLMGPEPHRLLRPRHRQRLWHKWWNGAELERLGEPRRRPELRPGSVLVGLNRIDTFVTGTDNRMWHKWWDGSGWRGWESLGGSSTARRRPSPGARTASTASPVGHEQRHVAPLVGPGADCPAALQDPHGPDLVRRQHDAHRNARRLQRVRASPQLASTENLNLPR